MQTEQNQLRTPDLPAEPVTHDDGGNQSHAIQNNAQAQQPSQPQPPESEERSEPQPWKDDKRLEIFSRAKERRQAETAPFSGDPNDPDALYGANVDQSDLGELEKEALRRRQEHLGQVAQGTQQGQQGQQGQQPQRKTLNGLDPNLLNTTATIIVDGEERQITVEEALRNYQIEEAAKRRLEQAKTILQQTHEFQRLQPKPGQQAEYPEHGQEDSREEHRGDDAEARGNTSPRPANARELVEKIQLGTPEEAMQALEEFVSSAVNRAPPVDETTRVLTALEDANAKQAVNTFTERYPQVASNPTLKAEVTREIYTQMAADLKQAGYSEQDLYKLAPTTQELTQLHKQARINGLKGVRSVLDLMEAGYHGALGNLRSLVEKSAPPSAQHPASSMAARSQRKESLQPQPAARRMSSGLSAPTQQRSVEQSRLSAVEKMRRARGQPV